MAKKMLSRRDFIKVLGATLGISLLASCVPSATQAPTAALVQPTAVTVQPLAVPTSVSSQKARQTNTEIAPSNNFPLVFVSTDTSSTTTPSRSDQIFVYQMDPTSGELTQISKAGGPPYPDFIRVDPSGRYLIAVSAYGTDPNRPQDGVGIGSSYTIDTKSGAISLINTQPIGDMEPVYISITSDGKWVLVADYYGGSVSVLPLGEDGRLGTPTDTVIHTGSVGPNTDRQDAPHAHSILLAPGSNLALAADLGMDKVLLYDFDPSKGTLSPHAPPAIVMSPGSGPRFMVFHPSLPYLYVLSELASTVTQFKYELTNGTFEKIETSSLLPVDFNGQNTSADIHITTDGKYLYASNRGHDSLAIFAIDAVSGKLTSLGYASSLGKTPWGFAIDPSDRFVLVANADSNTIVTLRIDPATGKLSDTGHSVQVPSPNCIKFLVR